jgi:hypothetical protein
VLRDLLFDLGGHVSLRNRQWHFPNSAAKP